MLTAANAISLKYGLCNSAVVLNSLKDHTLQSIHLSLLPYIAQIWKVSLSMFFSLFWALSSFFLLIICVLTWTGRHWTEVQSEGAVIRDVAYNGILKVSYFTGSFRQSWELTLLLQRGARGRDSNNLALVCRRLAQLHKKNAKESLLIAVPHRTLRAWLVTAAQSLRKFWHHSVRAA